MAAVTIKVTAALMVVVGVIAARALASPSPAPQTGGFGGRPVAYTLHLDTSLAAGSMRELPCASGARPGSRCYVAIP